MRVPVLVLCALTTSAAAQPADDAKTRADAAYAAGAAAYTANDFKQAVQRFEEAYALVPDPAYVFNIGQAHRQAGDCAQAAAAFTKYITLAPTAPNIANAKELLAEVEVCVLRADGRRLMDTGHPADACAKFEAARTHDPRAAATLLDLGWCNEQLGKPATAARWFRAAAAGKPPVADEAKRRVDALAAKIPHVDLDVPAGARVTLDGDPIAQPTGIEIDPGRHTIVVEGPATRRVSRTFAIAAGGHERIDLTGTPRSNRLVYVLGGTGLALWAGTAVLGVVGKQRYDDATTFDEQDKWKAIVRYGGTSMFVLGTAAVTTSVVLYLRRRHPETPAVAPVVGARDVGIAWTGSF